MRSKSREIWVPSAKVGLALDLAQYCSFILPDVRAYTTALLRWWQVNSPTIPAWAQAARIVFAMSCTSAAAERVFSLVKTMYGEEQISALADQIQAGVMSRYNKRCVG